MKVAMLTGGGDCPGLNPVIRGAVRTLHNAGHECIGLLEGWRGAINGNFRPLHPTETDNIIDKGGTILGSSRTNPYKDPAHVKKLLDSFQRLGIDALIAVGGDDTLGVARRLYEDHGLHTVGCPKTIDNDLSCTDYTFGFDTSINIVMDALDRVKTTAESHRRIVVVETMGRHAGWIACFSGIAGNADYILVPEQPVNVDHMCEMLKKRRENGKLWGLVVVSEGIKLGEAMVTKDATVDEFGHEKLGGVGDAVAQIIEKRTGIETRAVILGHLQRGGTPTAFDRVLGTRLGVHAGRLVMQAKWGHMVALRGMSIVPVPLAEAVGTNRKLYPEFMDEAGEFFQA